MFGNALRLLRRSHDLKQQELALKLNISRSYISELESGNRTPSYDLLERYAITFNIPVSSLIFFAESLNSGDNGTSRLYNAKGLIARKILNMLEILDDGNEPNDQKK